MKNKRLLFNSLLLSMLFLIAACSIRQSTEDTVDMHMVDEEQAIEAGMSGGGETAQQTENDLGIELGDKIIENANLSYETTHFEETLDFVDQQISEYGGALQHSSRGSNDTFGYTGDFISMTIRIPHENLHPFIDTLNDYDQLFIQSQEVGRTDVTRTYRDNETRIAILREEEAALREMLQEQGSLEEILQIRTRLSEVIAEREIYENQNQDFDEQIEYSTIHVSIQQSDRASRDVSGFWSRFTNAIEDAFYSFIGVMQQLIINLVYLFPYLILLLIIGLIVYFIVRKIRK